MPETSTYDLVVIGSGPAGEKGAAQAAYFGKRVALIERGPLGGACVNTGTLPSKCLRESALHLSGFRQRGIAGLTLTLNQQVRVDAFLAHKARVCEHETERIRGNLGRHRVDLLQGAAEIIDASTVRVRSASGVVRELKTTVILVATGTRPFRPPTMDFDTKEIYDSDEILSLDFVPKGMAIVGAGVIGCEYASMFAALGVKVTLIEPRDRLLPFVDEEVADALVRSFQSMGIEIRFGTTVEKAVVVGSDDAIVTLKIGEGDKARREELRVPKVLYAAGRTGNTEGLGLEKLGVKPDKRGQIAVNENYQTACPTLYAAGDVIGFPALASTSMDQARIAMCHAFDLKYKKCLSRHLPYGIYTVPEVSMVGETEQSLKLKKEDYEVGRAFYRDNARGKITGANEGMLKIVFRPGDRKLIGVHIVGESAAELVHIGLTVMQFDGTIDTFIDAVYNYPTLSETYKYAAYDGLGRLQRRGAAPAVSAAPAHA